jgi:large subunit ribosomal protein L24
MNKLRKGDEIIVITGKDKGKRGVVSARVSESLILVDGVNQVKKHQKPNPMKNEVGGIVAKTMPIQQSNVAIYNAATGKADRVGVRVDGDGVKARVYRSTGGEIKQVGA